MDKDTLSYFYKEALLSGSFNDIVSFLGHTPKNWNRAAVAEEIDTACAAKSFDELFDSYCEKFGCFFVVYLETSQSNYTEPRYWTSAETSKNLTISCDDLETANRLVNALNKTAERDEDDEDDEDESWWFYDRIPKISLRYPAIPKVDVLLSGIFRPNEYGPVLEALNRASFTHLSDVILVVERGELYRVPGLDALGAVIIYSKIKDVTGRDLRNSKPIAQ